jgi:hypothetical protein
LAATPSVNKLTFGELFTYLGRLITVTSGNKDRQAAAGNALFAQRGVFENSESIPLLRPNVRCNCAVKILIPLRVLIDKLV